MDQNGIITVYEVRVDPTQFQDVSYINVSGSELVLVVDGLEEFVEYNFTIRAYTIAGPGPFSVITTSTTDQAGEGSACGLEKHCTSSEYIIMPIISLNWYSSAGFCLIKTSALKMLPYTNKFNMAHFRLL